MPEPKNPAGSSAQDAGMATEAKVDLNAADSKEELRQEDEGENSQGENSEQEETLSEDEESESDEDEDNESEDDESEEDSEDESDEDDSDGESEDDSDEEKAEYLKEKSEKNAARKIQQVTSELAEAQRNLKEYEDAQELLVRNEANTLYKIAENNPKLADKLVAKIYGEQGVETFEELKILSQRNAANESEKPIYDKLLAQEKELREIRQQLNESKLTKEQEELASFKASHPDFRGELKVKAIELRKESKNTFSLERSYVLAKALVTSKDPDVIKRRAEEQAMIRVKQNSIGAKRGGESKAMGKKGKSLTPQQLTMAQRFGNDPSKVY